jgi:hypothetical protein
MNSTIRANLMHRYRRFVRAVSRVMGTTGVTYAENPVSANHASLEATGRRLFGARFKGVFMADQVPTLTPRHPYAIVNTEATPGRHWIGVAYIGGRPRVLVYNSLGKRLANLPRELWQKYPDAITTEPDAEQGVNEDNCGQRVLAWLLMLRWYGVKAAQTI